MVLTKGDDFPIHQTSEPIAYSGTDRNFYDRYFFNGYALRGRPASSPPRSASIRTSTSPTPPSCVVRDGVRDRAARLAAGSAWSGWTSHVGPIAIEVLEPLQKLKLKVDAPDKGIRAEIVFEGRAFPIEEPRFIRRNGPRTFMDYTRLTQNGRYTGWIELDGKRESVDGFVGTRDRSWGIRPVGAPRRAGAGAAAGRPVLLDLVAVQLRRPARSSSTPTTTPAASRGTGARSGPGTAPTRPAHAEIKDCGIEIDWKSGTRHAKKRRGHAAGRRRRARDHLRAAVRVLHARPRLRPPEVGPRRSTTASWRSSART